MAGPHDFKLPIALGFSSGFIKLYDCKNPAQKMAFAPVIPENAVYTLSFSCDDEYLAAVLDSGEVSLFKISISNKVHSFNVDGKANIARFHPTNPVVLAIGTKHGSLIVYNINRKSTPLCSASKLHAGIISELVFSKQQAEIIYTAGFDKKIRTYDMKEKKTKQTYTSEGPIRTMGLASNGYTMLVGTLNYFLEAIDMRTLTPISKKQYKQHQVNFIATLPQLDSFNQTNLNVTAATNVTATEMDMSCHNPDDSLLGKIRISGRSSDINERGSGPNSRASTATDDSLLGHVQISRRASDVHEVATVAPTSTAPNPKRTSLNAEPPRTRRNTRASATAAITPAITQPIPPVAPIQTVLADPIKAEPSVDSPDAIHVTPKRRKSSKNRIDIIQEESLSVSHDNKENFTSPFFNAQDAKSSTPQIPFSASKELNSQQSSITPVPVAGQTVPVDQSMLAILVMEIRGFRSDVASLSDKVDRLSEKLEQVKLDVQYKIDEAQFNVFNNNHNYHMMSMEHIEDIEAAFSTILRANQKSPLPQ